MVDDLEVDSWSDRAVSLVNQWLHLMLAHNYFFILDVMGFVFATIVGGKWHEWQLWIRQNKTIAPFQHRHAKFLRRPSIYQLLSIRQSFRKNYKAIARAEIQKRDLFLKCIPAEHHEILFPWLTEEVLSAMRDNEGISEFTWIFSADGDRTRLNDFFSDRLFITMINTTWVHNDSGGGKLKPNHGQRICENLTYLPNLNQADDRQIVLMAKAATEYAKSLGADGGSNGHCANGHVANGQ